MARRTFAQGLQGGLLGAEGGAAAGAPFGGFGEAIGGGIGGLLGATGGILDAQANAPFDQLNLQEQGLNNDLLQQKLEAARRENRQGGMTEKGFNLFRGFLGSAFKANAPTSFGAGLKAYPGLGNQGTP